MILVRRHKDGILFLFLGCLVVAATAATAKEFLSGPVPAVVTKVLDGDTLQVRARIWLDHEVTTRVRLAGIDAPETNGKCARERALAAEALAFVRTRLELEGAATAPILLTEIRYGKYAGRVLARVETRGGEDLGQALLAAGLARPYDGRRRPSWCEVVSAQ